MKRPAIYIMANRRNGTLYTGVTANLPKRVYEHKSGVTSGFTAQHQCHMLVYYATFDTMEAAIAAEKRIKSGSRKKKLALIEGLNPDWIDLYENIAA